jgi:small-conductance mechanosensitive channel/CRP-like cAMP-binding protein
MTLLGLAPALVLVALLVAAGLTVAGALLLRTLVRRQAPWWPSVAPPLLLWGTAFGLLTGSLLHGGPLTWGEGPDHVAANLGWTLIAFFGATALLGIVRSFLRSRVVTEGLGLHIPELLLDGARYVLWIAMVFLVVGGIWGRTEWFSALFTASAVGTVILGFALQETLANFFAGMALVSERTYAIGDWVWVGDLEGKVLRITRRSTRLRTRVGDIVTMSNRAVSSSVIRNTSMADPAHAEFVVVAAPYDAPPNQVRAVLERAVKATPEILADPAPRFRLKAYADSGIDYEIRFCTRDLDRIPDIKSSLMVHIWYYFRRAGISFPYPVRELRRLEPGFSAPPITPAGIRRRLVATPLFAELSDELLDLLVEGTRVIEYGAQQTVIVQGETGSTCYVVDVGRVAAIVSDGSAERRVAELGPGELFGELGLLTGNPRTTTVRTLEDARLLEIGAGTMRVALERSPDLAQRLAEITVLRRAGLLEVRAALDSAAASNIRSESLRLGEAIRRFLTGHEDAGRPRGSGR